ncbi:hypothetical protein OsI_35819 [Oryza sativa Indica Group]|uniref:Uncharacterized protein n=1 Tax=Oryza sativa subsp. indica TaxID=39946 RepID=B8BK22_ORYSI|nr:hypothetical protein OsI_35819 [Oryza sativa Indica Group]
MVPQTYSKKPSQIMSTYGEIDILFPESSPTILSAFLPLGIAFLLSLQRSQSRLVLLIPSASACFLLPAMHQVEGTKKRWREIKSFALSSSTSAAATSSASSAANGPLACARHRPSHAVLSHPPPFENKRRREIKSSSPPPAGQRVLSSSRAKGVAVQARVAARILVTSPVIHRRKDLVARVSGGEGAWPWRGSSVVVGSLAAAAKDLDGGARESGALDPLEGRLDPTRGTAARQGGSPLVRRHP